MTSVTLNTTYKRQLADTLTPVSIYLRLRDKYQGCILLESSDYHGHDNSYSYICCQPIASFKVGGGVLDIAYPDKTTQRDNLTGAVIIEEFERFRTSFKYRQQDFKFSTGGLFGYMAYDTVRYFEDLKLQHTNTDIPDICYQVYRYVIVVDHFKNEMYVFDHVSELAVDLDTLIGHIRRNDNPQFNFTLQGDESASVSEADFMEMVTNGIGHCQRGDVFQLVLSRRFAQAYQGDEFNVYRALRSINPSPYLFYFDYGSFKLFGSSPESQILIKGDKASIFPIAGTFRRTGNDQADAELAEKLSADEKENAEHIMLVDLARNDLSKSATQVEVEVLKEVQYYSHVLHLVSKVSGRLADSNASMQLVADTFPAGTLSGAPKYKAMTLIDRYEPVSRNFYAGAIGLMDFNGDFNHAIMIRSFLSKDNTLHYQAGAGVVVKSDPKSELNEVNNKLAALRKAMQNAEEL